MLADAFTAVGAVMAAVGGLVVTVVTAVRMVWDWEDRRRLALDKEREGERAELSKASPTIHTYTKEDMKAFLADRAREGRGQQQAQQGPDQPQDHREGPRRERQQADEPVEEPGRDYQRQEEQGQSQQPRTPTGVPDVPIWLWDLPPRRRGRLLERLDRLLEWLAYFAAWAWWNAARLGAGLIVVGAVVFVIGLLRG